MDYKRDAFLVIDPVTGATKLVEQPKEPEQIVEAFLKEAKKPNSLIWALDELVVKDWKKWSGVRQELWDTLEELDDLGY
jgi:hypothetical protein